MLFDPSTVARRTELKHARQQLARVSDDAPEPVYAEANARVAAAGEQLHWAQRLDIDAGLYDHGDVAEY
jgi:hypothetical protein